MRTFCISSLQEEQNNTTQHIQPMSTGDPDTDGWERSDFPIVCETCLGDNPYIRMTKLVYDKECKVCARPFTVFRWQAGTKGRFKKTEICQTCAKMKNVCQTCLLDLVFNLPTQVRDAALANGQSTAMPQSIVGRDYTAQQNEQLVASGQLPFDKVQYAPMMQKLARPTPYYERNKAHVCSFFLKGNCTRGDSCPYRHEQPKENNELAKQNIKDRYFGANDPVAQKILKKLNTNAPQTPTDTDIKTVYIGNVDTRISEQDLRDHFYYYGEIHSVKMNPTARCAFVEFTTRDAAEEAVAKLHNNLIINGIFLRIDWAKAQQSTDRNQAPPTAYEGYGYNPATGYYPPPPGYLPPPGYGHNYYPSMNPQRMGATPQNKPGAAPGAPAPNQAKKQARDESAESAEQPPNKKQKVEHAAESASEANNGTESTAEQK